MQADSTPPDQNNPSRQQSGAEEDPRQRELRRAKSLLRLLKSSDDQALDDNELRKEFDRLNKLLRRIDELAAREEHRSAQPREPKSDPAAGMEAPVEPAQASKERDIDPGIAPFDPGELGGHKPDTPEAPVQAPPSGSERPSLESQSSKGESSSQRSSAGSEGTAHASPKSTQPEGEPNAANGDENLARWWINFNGDISLERLARLRALLSESPFTIETRFEEITDGLIVLRVVTESHVSMEQVDWIVRQLMDAVGLDRNSAIVSRQ